MSFHNNLMTFWYFRDRNTLKFELAHLNCTTLPVHITCNNLIKFTVKATLHCDKVKATLHDFINSIKKKNFFFALINHLIYFELPFQLLSVVAVIIHTLVQHPTFTFHTYVDLCIILSTLYSFMDTRKSFVCS